jgi:hypothetical protein
MFISRDNIGEYYSAPGQPPDEPDMKGR